MTYAGFWKRFIALIVDTIILIVITVVLMSLTGVIVGGIFDNRALLASIINATLWINILIVWLYFALQESSSKQATLGKRLLKIYVTNREEEQLTFAQATIRHFSKYLSSIFFIGFIMAAFTKDKQALHDLIADTLVINR